MFFTNIAVAMLHQCCNVEMRLFFYGQKTFTRTLRYFVCLQSCVCSLL